MIDLWADSTRRKKIGADAVDVGVRLDALGVGRATRQSEDPIRIRDAMS